MRLALIGLVLAPAPAGEVPIQQPDAAQAWALQWSAPEACPGRDALLAGIRTYLPNLDDPPLEVGRADLRIDASVLAPAAHGEAWTLRLRTSGREGESQRELEAPDCDALADAVALIAAVALDPVLVARQTREALAAAHAPAPDVPLAQAQVPEPEPARPESEPSLVLAPLERIDAPRRRVGFAASLRGGGGNGPTANAFGHVTGGFALLGARFRWQLDAGIALPRTLAIDEGRRGRVIGWSVGSDACLVTRVKVVELPICLGFEGGLVHARGLAPTANTRAQRQPWLAPRLRSGLRWSLLPRLALLLDLDLLVPLVRAGFTIGDATLTSVPALALRGGAGVELRF
jgi:hypothetical protein